jgi:glycosyltransferase involved in cell wall biosynthesis
LRVTLISKAFVVGSYQTKLEALAAYDDIELTVVVPPSWREGRHTLHLERLHTRGYQLIVAPIAFTGHFHLHYYPTLPAILRASQPDICHIDEEPYNLATYLAVRAARRVGAGTVFFTWQNLLRGHPFPFNCFERYVYRHVDAAIAGNRDAVEVLYQKGYVGPVQLVPQFGVDPQVFRPADEHPPHTPFTIGYAGRLVQQKGLGILVDALEHLLGAWRLILYGTGPMQEELKARLARLGLAERVRFEGHLPSTEMPQVLAALDVLVLPSLTRPNWKEQFGRVLIEAMSCGVPVIGSDSGEIPYVIGEGGLIFPEGDARALRSHLERLMADAELREGLGTRGRARVLAHYTQARIAAETVAFYRVIRGNVESARGRGKR